jgi:hypothetical protein
MLEIAPEFWVRGWAQLGGLSFYNSCSGEVVLKIRGESAFCGSQQLQPLAFSIIMKPSGDSEMTRFNHSAS